MKKQVQCDGEVGGKLSRRELAENMLQAFECGASNAITVRAGTRSGKSEFLRADLIPEAVKRGFKTVYICFKSVNSSPEALLCKGIASMMSNRRQSGADELLELRNHFQQLIKSGDRVLLCLDDIDQLAPNPKPESFTFFLRTVLDQNRYQIAVVFTGSDRAKLHSVFMARHAPFYKSSVFVDLP